jgi:ABC-type multidrug transport system fused ATPase/permease subunit
MGVSMPFLLITASLRDRIGVVPQSPILFDDTIMNNVRYGRITASDEEVFEACRASCIHDKIKGFTHGRSHLEAVFKVVPDFE